MKKVLLFCIFITMIVLSVSAQGFYLDVGLSVGAFIFDSDIEDIKTKNGVLCGFGFKSGYGPNENLPLYFVGTVDTGYGPGGKYNPKPVPFYLGFGIIYYPIRLFQVGASMGLSHDTFLKKNGSPVGTEGFAYDISAAIDLGKNKNGLLLGVKFKHSTSDHADERMSLFDLGFFVKYTYRDKSSIF